jgi:hypothetical protein
MIPGKPIVMHGEFGGRSTTEYREDVVRRVGKVSGMGEVQTVKPILVRELIGETLREERTLQGKTLREVSKAARVSLGYLSEVERGQKEASSELLAAICGALDVPLSVILSVVSEKLSIREKIVMPLPVRPLARAAA